MLESTFLHLPGVGPTSEEKLWNSGISTWGEYEARFVQPTLFEIDGAEPDSPLSSSWRALRSGDANYFARLLPRSEYHRILLSFPAQTLFVDIETTGLSRWYDYITVVGWEMDGVYGAHVTGQRPERMYEAFAKAKAIVTFNGTMFDIPFLKKEFPNLPIPECHVDLRFFSRRTDISGGQKIIEKQLGIERPMHLQDVVGESAPVLWYAYRWGDLKSLELLVEYNHSDIQGLKQILDIVVERYLEGKAAPVRAQQIPVFYTSPSAVSFDPSADSSIHLKPYVGNPGPATTYQGLHVPYTLRVVGIDLTGSEERPSGWCCLNGNKAVTLRLGTDDEIVAQTVQAGAALVSIDSPLSLPAGRSTVYDSDPARKSHGIMRECERVLKKRGVSVYPCLIPSMQRLTERGIKLADRFRKLGIPVIESYPGAAQDILGIPRKRASLKYLQDGLIRFGIVGQFQHVGVSHDELDAITSAMVGLFFWAGHFEALGNEDEEYLIIPDLENSANRWGSSHVIGISGPIASGKTTAGTLLKEMDFHYNRYSRALRQIAEDRGMDPSRENLQLIGQEIYLGNRQRWLGKQLLALLPAGKNLVIDGMRHPEDLAFLIETFGPTFTHVHVDAEINLRCERYCKEGFSEVDFEHAVAHDVESNIPSLKERAHMTVLNNRSKDEYLAKMAELADFTNGRLARN